jgi:hypothetical protein
MNSEDVEKSIVTHIEEVNVDGLCVLLAETLTRLSACEQKLAALEASVRAIIIRQNTP